MARLQKELTRPSSIGRVTDSRPQKESESFVVVAESQGRLHVVVKQANVGMWFFFFFLIIVTSRAGMPDRQVKKNIYFLDHFGGGKKKLSRRLLLRNLS